MHENWERSECPRIVNLTCLARKRFLGCSLAWSPRRCGPLCIPSAPHCVEIARHTVNAGILWPPGVGMGRLWALFVCFLSSCTLAHAIALHGLKLLLCLLFRLYFIEW